MGPLILVQAFQSIRSNRHPILGSDTLEFMTMPLHRRRGRVCRGAGPAGLGFGPNSSLFVMYSPEIRTHPKLVELIRIKQNINGT